VAGENPPALPVVNPEEGWDDKTEAKCVILHYTTRKEVERRGSKGSSILLIVNNSF